MGKGQDSGKAYHVKKEQRAKKKRKKEIRKKVSDPFIRALFLAAEGD